MVEFVEKQVEELKKLWSNKRQLAFQALNLAMIVLSALMIWKSLMVVTKSESPVVVVLRSVHFICCSLSRRYLPLQGGEGSAVGGNVW